MTVQLPQVIHTYQNHALDSTRWQHYRPRSDDIIIATSYKSGTTWMQEIVRQLIFLGQDVPERDDVTLGAISFWLDMNGAPIEEVIGKTRCRLSGHSRGRRRVAVGHGSCQPRCDARQRGTVECGLAGNL